MAADSGMTKQQGEEATGGLFALVKKNISEEQYKQITSKIPQIDTLVNKEESSTSTDRASGGGGLMLGLASMAGGGSGGSGSSGGGGAMAALIGICGKYGISAKQVNAFLPKLVPLVKKQCGVDIGSMLGLPSESGTNTGGAAGGSQTAGGGGDAVSGMMSSAMGMFGKK